MKDQHANHPRVNSFEKWDHNKTNILTPLKAIREKCLDCTAYSPKEVELCVCKTCGLYPYRFGKSPGHRREMSREQKADFVKRVNKNRRNT